MTIEKYINLWNDVLTRLKQKSEYSAYGWLNSSGKLLAGNQTLCVFLGTTQGECNPAYRFINPEFEQISRIDSGSELVFEGWLTIGDFKNINFSLNAKIFQREGIYFIFAEADALNLFQQNKNMSRLNQEVNNLQRQLLKEKRKLEQALDELKETQQMLIHSEKMNALGQMVAGIAHEINNPVAFVTNNLYELGKYSGELVETIHELEVKLNNSGNVDALKILNGIKNEKEFDFLAEDISDVLNSSQDGVRRVKEIVEDLRKFSRLDESEKKHIDLVDSLKSTISIVKAKIEEKNVIFSFVSTGKVMVDCFPGQLNQAVLNLIINAIQAVEQGGKVILEVKRSNEETQIVVKDNGCGISPEDQEKIFNPFFTTKPVGSGTGLGLSITYKIITDLHKGRIEVESEEGKGTTFSVSIPNTIVG